MSKKILFAVLIAVLSVAQTVAQTSVGINTIEPNSNAVLELIAPNGDQGFLIPKLDSTQREAMTLSELESGLMIFSTTDTMFYFWNGSAWQKGLSDLSYLYNITATMVDSSVSHYNSIDNLTSVTNYNTYEIDTLNTNVALLQAALDKLTSEQSLEAILIKGNSANNTIKDLNDPVDASDAATKNYVDLSNQDLSDRITDNTSRIETNETNISDHESRIVTVENSTADHETRLTDTEAKVTDNTSRIETNENAIADHESRISANETSRDDHETRITTIESTTADHETRISDTETTILDHASRIETNETTIADHETRLTTTEATVTDNVTRISTLENNVDVIRDSVDILNNISTTNSSNIITLRDSVITNITNTATNTTRIKELSDSTVNEIAKNNARSKATSDSLNYLYQTGKVALTNGTILIGLNDSATAITPSGDIVIDATSGDVQIQAEAIDPTNIAGIADNGVLGNVLVSKGDGTFEWQDKFAGGMSNNLENSKIWIGGSDDTAVAQDISGAIVLSNDGSTYIATDSVTTRTIMDGNVTNDKIDKANIPLSGFANAEADIAIGDGTTNYKITGVANPVADFDVANKKYIDDSLAVVRDSITNITNDINIINDSIINITNDIKVINDSITNITNDIKIVNDSITNITNDIKVLNDSITNITNDIKIINDSITNITNDIKVINDSITNITNDIKIVNDSITNITNDIKVINDSITNITNDIQIINDSITNITNDIKVINDSITNITNDIDIINDSIINITNDIDVINDSIVNINTSVNNLFDSITNITNVLQEGSVNLDQGHIFVGDTDDTARAVTMSGVVTITETGVTSVEDGTLVASDFSADVAGTALGNGDAGYMLTSNGNGSFSWENPSSVSVSPDNIALARHSIFVGNSSNKAGAVAMQGDATIVDDGTITIVNDAITTAKILDGNVTLAKVEDIATASFLGRNTAGDGIPEVLDVATAKSLLNLSNTNTGDITIAGEDYLSLTNQVLTANAITLSGSNVTGTLPVGNGGTGQTSYTDGQLLIGNSTGNTLTKATLTGTADQIAISNGAGTIQISTPQDIATSSSPEFTGLTLSGTTASKVVFTDASKALTTSGTVGVDQGGTGLTSIGANQILYAPSANTFAGLSTANNGVLLTNGTGVPSIGNTIGAALTMPSLNLSASTNQIVFNSSASTGTLSWTPTTDRNISLQDADGTLAFTTDITVQTVDKGLALTGTKLDVLVDDVTTEIDGSNQVSIKNKGVSFTKMQDITTNTFLGRNEATDGSPEELSIADAKTLLGLTGSNAGDVTLAGQNYLTLSGQEITANQITLSGTHVTGTLPVDKGGTGQTSYTNGQLLIGNSTGNTLTKATLDGTTDQIVVTNSAGAIQISTPQDIATTSSPQFASLILNGATSGSITLEPTAIAGSNTITLPAVTGTLALTDGSITTDNVPRWDGNTFINSNVWCNTDGGNTRTVIGSTATPASYDYSLEVVGSFKTAKIYHSSDERWKKNIQTVDSALNKVEKLRGVTYDWKREEFPNKEFAEGTQIGLIAQEVEAVLPELVNTGTDGYKAVEYANVVAVLIEAIKEQQQMIDKQKTDIEALKAESAMNAEYMKQIKSLETQMNGMKDQITALTSIIQMVTPVSTTEASK